MRVLLLSAYDAVSHRYWRQGLVAQFPQWQWTQLALPARHFSWRIRGNSLSWGLGQSELLNRDYDLVVATSMTDLATLRGLVPKLGTIPTLVYFHENQFAYPLSDQRTHSVVELQMLNLYTALAADRVLFNSHYNRNTFLDGVEALLSRLPDHVPPDVRGRLEGLSSVLPVPLLFENSRGGGVDWGGTGDAVRILWAARWEYDKGPERLLAALRMLEEKGVNYRLCILGERFRRVPEVFDIIENQFRHRLAQFGFADSRDQYLAWLASAHFFVSTSLHEFQGIAALEAVQQGCVPVLPKRLAYPELVPEDYLYASDLDSVEREAQALVERLMMLAQARQPAPDVSGLCWAGLEASYRQLFETLARA
ncbi:tRNA-queuosine alpha-mannosyltransferase domain-containing protein [Aestuariirhabdus sp. LZHN29]|uniref:tRNA-queuosine alpha-mannosyltransferase domain-containing protein n=1 Tax=Aestuariirhabdus sp. LZHN29 TaxID=3417462 RepID=UPI003CF62501